MSNPPKVILFTGHRVDQRDRAKPRFPADKVDQARAMIYAAVAAEQEQSEGELLGIAGGANGADILFHEICAELGITTQVYLALPRAQYIDASVVGSGADWVPRFDQLCARSETFVLTDSTDMPPWPNHEEESDDIWLRTNLWMLHAALKIAQGNIVTMAFWNGKQADGPGGTEDLFERTSSLGARVVQIDARRLLDT